MDKKVRNLIYRGIKYTTDSINGLKKKNKRKELTYRGTKFFEDNPKKENSSTSKRCYRGTCY